MPEPDTLSWLPDAPLDPHPALTWLVECCFDLAVRSLYRREVCIAEDYSLDPGMLVVSNHQHDADVPIITSSLCRREGVHLRWPLPFCAAREDMFQPGFLGKLLAHWPAPLPAVLACVPLRWLWRIVRVRPLRRVRELSFGEALAECTNCEAVARDAHRALNARGKREVAARLGEVPVRLERLLADSRIDDLRHAVWGLRRLAPEARAALAPRLRADIEAQLASLASLLNAGRVVFIAPEGANSESGAFGRMRAGAWRISRLAQERPAVLPVALSYDPLDAGRLRAVVRVGRPLRGLDCPERRDFDSALRRHILDLYAVTPSHLASRFLVAGPQRFRARDLAAWLERGAAAVARAGLSADPLLKRADVVSLAERRLAWLARRGLVGREGDWCLNRWPRDAAPGWKTPANIVRYLDNALESLAAERQALRSELRP